MEISEVDGQDKHEGEKENSKSIPIRMLCGHTLNNLTENDKGQLVCKKCYHVFRD